MQSLHIELFIHNGGLRHTEWNDTFKTSNINSLDRQGKSEHDNHGEEQLKHTYILANVEKMSKLNKGVTKCIKWYVECSLRNVIRIIIFDTVCGTR